MVSENSLFRAEKYPSDYIGFSGKDLTPQGIIENMNSVTDVCVSSLGISSNTALESLIILNPVEHGMIQFNKIIKLDGISIYDINGRLVFEHGLFHDNKLHIDVLPSIYFMQLSLGERFYYNKNRY